MKSIFLFLAVISISFSCIEPVQNAADETIYKKVDYAVFNQLYMADSSSAILLDVRTPKEYNAAHIDGALNLNYYEKNFKEELAQLDTTKTVFVYCHSGGRSFRAGKVLASLGFKKVYDLKGGFSRVPR